MSATKREEVSSHLRYIRLELREMYQMLVKEDLLPDLNEAKEVHAQLDALYELLAEKRIRKIKLIQKKIKNQKKNLIVKKQGKKIHDKF